MKVYCKDCRYEVGFQSLRYPDEGDCLATIKWEDTHWRQRKIGLTQSTVNDDNNCEYYKRKWWKRWVK